MIQRLFGEIVNPSGLRALKVRLILMESLLLDNILVTLNASDI